MESVSVAEEIDLSKGVKTLQELSKILQGCRERGQRIVHCHGVFDLLHVGHLRHLKKARQMGDILVVTVTPDCYVNKGPNRPAFAEQLRVEAVDALEFVDYVAINQWANAVETIQLLRPHFYVKGKDYREVSKDKTGGIKEEKAAVESVGGELVITEEITFSSSSLINQHLSLFTPEMESFIQAFSRDYSYEYIEEEIEKLASLKVLLVGESIIDDYQYCRTMGKPGKDPILAACYERNETFVGGVLAVANHVAGFCNEAGVVSFLGSNDSYEPFIREKLHTSITPHFLRMSKSCSTIVKRRFLEQYPLQKLFEVYIMENDEGCSEDSSALCKQLEEVIPLYDVVIVTDYGHGMMSSEAIHCLTEKAQFLAVNTQVNAGNHAFNTISKYPRADFVCISENELRLDVRSKKRPIEEILEQASAKLGGAKVMVTRGKEGLLSFDPHKGHCNVPAFIGNTLDRVGAGDSVLAVASMCVKQQIPMEVVGLIGNAVGFQAVQTVGNREAVDKVKLLKSLEHSLK